MLQSSIIRAQLSHLLRLQDAGVGAAHVEYNAAAATGGGCLLLPLLSCDVLDFHFLRTLQQVKAGSML
jgi:hypothetical protein